MVRASREVVRALPLFSTVGAEFLGLLMRDVALLEFERFANVFKEGDPVFFLYTVVEGTVELFRSRAGNEATLHIVHLRETFFLPAVLRNQTYRQSARTLTSARILRVPAATIRELFDQDQGFARAIAMDLAMGYNSAIKALEDLKLCSSAERLANWILEAHNAQGGTGQVTLKYPKRTLASYLGMRPENLSRTLADLAEHGISIKGRVMVVEDPQAMQRWSRRESPVENS